MDSDRICALRAALPASRELEQTAIPAYPTPALNTLPLFVILGIAAGITGVMVNSGIIATLNLFTRTPQQYRLGAAAVVGAVVGLAGWFSPLVIGGESISAEQAQAVLERLEHAVLPLDAERVWYRYHHLFNDILALVFRKQAPLGSAAQDLQYRFHELPAFCFLACIGSGMML